MKRGLTLLVLLVLAIGTVGPLPLPARGQTVVPEQWPGSWVMGPSLDTSMLGCTVGDGLGRFTGYYYAPQNRVYFLGGRCENNATTGAVFYFDPVTRAFATTGVTMPVPVSNYHIAALEDGRGHGLGLYIVGGRTGTGAQTNAVQVYYPYDNTVETIASDPFSPATPYSPGAVVSAEGKLYVFGGFDGVSMYATTWVYDPAAAAGSRWTDIDCDLPTARSYIAAVAVGQNIYAMGGDEYSGGLVPLDDTLVLDINNLAACWQDGAMPDLPQANGDAPAVYVPADQFLGDPGGAIYVIGGYWPSPGPYRWVFRYDIAGGSWEEFPELAIPAPASGRRNQAAVYIPFATGVLGLGNGVPGLWAFGGYDGSGTNAMTESSEYFSYAAHQVLLLPDQLRVAGVGGTTVENLFTLVNLTGVTETFDLSYTADVTWTVGMPRSIGPMGPGLSHAVTFTVAIDLPAEVACPAGGTFTLGAVAQSNPDITDTQSFVADITCGLVGYVRDATTGRPIANAYVWMQTDPAGLTGEYYDGFTDENGWYVFSDVVTGTYLFGADAQYYMPSFYPVGWPTGSLVVDIPFAGLHDVELLSSQMGWSPSNFDWVLRNGTSFHDTLTIVNEGTGPLYYGLSELSGDMPQPPARAQAVPSVDPQILADLAAAPDGRAEFLVVLKEQANLDGAYAIQDWNARGEYVLRQLQQTAERSQRGLRSLLDAAGVEYKPLYITNAIIVKNGTQALVNSLASRPEVDYLMANYRIAIEDPIEAVNSGESPEAIEWNIQKVNADDVWGLGYTGQGVVVAEIDTGTQYDHPALVNQYRGNLGGGSFDHNYNWYDPYNQCPPGIPCDGGQHGTHVMGTMVGDDGGTNQIGMAPGAKWISCKGGDAVSGYLLTDELLQCAEWILAPFDLQGQNPDPAMRPHVVNNSWGGGPNDYWYAAAVDAWRAAGIFPAFATGNAGPSCGSAHSPGDNWNTFGVGATDINDNIASFSGRGPALYTGVLKPQVTAPGVNIRSSVPGGTYQGGWSGTSMATPHVAGAVALLWSAAPDLIGQIDTTAWLLERGALPLTTNEGCGGDSPTDVPNNTFGWGRLDILTSVNMALDGAATIPWLAVSPVGGVVEPGGSVAIDLEVTAPVTPGLYTGTLLLWADDPVNHDARIPLTLQSVPCTDVSGVEFDWSPTTPTVGLMALFTATVDAGSPPLVYTWDFGDGTDPVVVTTTTALHAYTTAGAYTVTLTVSNPCSTLAVEHALVVEAAPIPMHKIYLPLVFRGY